MNSSDLLSIPADAVKIHSLFHNVTVSVSSRSSGEIGYNLPGRSVGDFFHWGFLVFFLSHFQCPLLSSFQNHKHFAVHCHLFTILTMDVWPSPIKPFNQRSSFYEVTKPHCCCVQAQGEVLFSLKSSDCFLCSFTSCLVYKPKSAFSSQ